MVTEKIMIYPYLKHLCDLKREKFYFQSFQMYGQQQSIWRA